MVVKPQIDRFDQYIPYPQYLKLLLRATDGTTSGMKDFSGYGRVVTNPTGATGSTTQRKLNPYSMYFDGTNDYITTPSTTLSSDDFTISLWFNPIAMSTDYILDSVSGSVRNSLLLSSQTSILFGPDGGEHTFTVDTVSLNQWHHLYVSRTSGSVKLCVDGVGPEPQTLTTNFTDTGITLGSYNIHNSFWYNGYLDEVMVWVGVAIPISQLYPQTKPFSFRRA